MMLHIHSSTTALIPLEILRRKKTHAKVHPTFILHLQDTNSSLLQRILFKGPKAQQLPHGSLAEEIAACNKFDISNLS